MKRREMALKFSSDVLHEHEDESACVDRTQQKSGAEQTDGIAQSSMVNQCTDHAAQAVWKPFVLGEADHRGESGQRHEANEHR
jgi:hypothetical protein